MNQNWMKYGIMYALVSMVLTICFYYLIEISLSLQVIFSFGAMILFMILAALKERSDNEGYLSYGECLKTSFLTSLVGLVAAFLLSVVLFAVDPDLQEKLTQISNDASRSVMESMGMSEDQIAEAMEKAEEEGAAQFTLSKQFVGLITNSIFVFIIAAFISLFLKKNAPEEKF